MKKIIEYKLIECKDNTVNIAISNGYQPYGSPVFYKYSNDSEGVILQAMVKYEE
jgi:hypothetical protein